MELIWKGIWGAIVAYIVVSFFRGVAKVIFDAGRAQERLNKMSLDDLKKLVAESEATLEEVKRE